MLEFLVNRVGLWGFVAFLALVGVGLPIPEEAPLVLAGVLSRQGKFVTINAFAACLLGALLGDSIMYAIGRHLGHGFLLRHPLFARFINAEEEAKIEHVVQNHGFKILLGTRFLIGVRGAVYFAAGAARVPYLKFLMWDLVAASLVVGIVFGLGYLFGPLIEPIINDAEKLITVVVVVALIAVGLMVYRKRVERVDREIERLEREAKSTEPLLEVRHGPDDGAPEVAAPRVEAPDEAAPGEHPPAKAKDRSA